jgi:hypothetical protein
MGGLLSRASVKRAVVRCALGLGAGLLLHCADPGASDASCYEVGAPPDGTGAGAPDYCRWPMSQLPDPPPGFSFTRKVGVGFHPTDDEPCDPCDTDRFDALLHAEVEGVGPRAAGKSTGPPVPVRAG